MFGENLAQLRNEKNITQDELAQLVGVNKEKIIAWETTSQMPNNKEMEMMANVFQMSPEEFYSRVKNNNSTKKYSTSNALGHSASRVASRIIIRRLIRLALAIIAIIILGIYLRSS